MEIISRADAIARGLKKFYTAQPCTLGHVEERLISNKHCLACKRACNTRARSTPERREQHREESLQRAARIRADPELRERELQRQRVSNRERRAQQLSTPEGRQQLREERRQHYLNNREEVIERAKKWYADNTPAVSAKNKYRFREVVTPVALHTIDTIALLKTDEAREQFACWLTLLADIKPSSPAGQTMHNTVIDHFAADNEDAVNFHVYGITTPIPRNSTEHLHPEDA